MKLREWARKQGISYKPAWRWLRQGKTPIPFEQTPKATILVKEPDSLSGAVALCARGSSADHNADRDGQIARLVAYASEQGWAVTRAISEIGSGLNGHRPKIIRLLSDPKVNTISSMWKRPWQPRGGGLSSWSLDLVLCPSVRHRLDQESGEESPGGHQA